MDIISYFMRANELIENINKLTKNNTVNNLTFLHKSIIIALDKLYEIIDRMGKDTMPEEEIEKILDPISNLIESITVLVGKIDTTEYSFDSFISFYSSNIDYLLNLEIEKMSFDEIQTSLHEKKLKNFELMPQDEKSRTLFQFLKFVCNNKVHNNMSCIIENILKDMKKCKIEELISHYTNTIEKSDNKVKEKFVTDTLKDCLNIFVYYADNNSSAMELSSDIINDIENGCEVNNGILVELANMVIHCRTSFINDYGYELIDDLDFLNQYFSSIEELINFLNTLSNEKSYN